MYVFKVNGDSYKVRFSYGALCKSDLIDRVLSAYTVDEEKPAETLKRLIGLTAELLLEGLQKKHSDKFGYETDEERESRLSKVFDLIDDYEDEHEDDTDGKQDSFTLFNDLQGELAKNGFLSAMMTEAQATAASQDATVVPMDHQQKRKPRKVGESK